MRHETIAKGTIVMKDKQHYKALGKKLSRYESGNGMAVLRESVKNIRKQKVRKREKTRPTIKL